MEKLFFIGLLPVLLVLWIRKSAPESQEWIEDKYKDKSTFLSVFRKPHLSISMIVFLVCFCLFGANWPINGLLPSYPADNGVNTVVISTLMTIAGLGTLTGTIFFGFVGDKIGVKKAFVVGLITSFIFLCPLFFYFCEKLFSYRIMSLWINVYKFRYCRVGSKIYI